MADRLEPLVKHGVDNLYIVAHQSGFNTSSEIMYITAGNNQIVALGLEDDLIVHGNLTIINRKDRTQNINNRIEKHRLTPEFERYI